MPSSFAAHGKDKVGITGGECVLIGGLGHCTLKIPFAEDLAGADGQDGTGLLEANALRIVAVVEEDPESFDQVELIPGLCFGQNKEPQYHKGNDNGAAHQNEPAQFDSGAPGHDGKNHCVDHTHTHVAADTGNESQHEGGVSSDLCDGKDRADVVAPLLKLMDLHGQKQDIRDFHHFVGLDLNGEAGNCSQLRLPPRVTPNGVSSNSRKMMLNPSSHFQFFSTKDSKST